MACFSPNSLNSDNLFAMEISIEIKKTVIKSQLETVIKETAPPAKTLKTNPIETANISKMTICFIYNEYNAVSRKYNEKSNKNSLGKENLYKVNSNMQISATAKQIASKPVTLPEQIGRCFFLWWNESRFRSIQSFKI